jgi:hypothetical protein
MPALLQEVSDYIRQSARVAKAQLPFDPMPNWEMKASEKGSLWGTEK